MKIRPTLLGASLIAVAALTLTGCASGSPTDTASSSGDTATGTDGVSLINAGKLTVCSDIPYEPFEFTKDGENVGFDLDIAGEIAKTLDVELNVIDISFDIISGGAFKTQCDIAISGISITDSRKANMNFSTPYLDDDLVLVANVDSGITSVKDAVGKTVGVQKSTTGEEYANENGLTATAFEDSGLQVQALVSGATDASLGNQSILRYAIKDNPDLKVVEEIKTGEQLGVAVPKESPALLDAVNETLERIDDDGTMASFETKWFGSD